jgi:hypothetical protein
MSEERRPARQPHWPHAALGGWVSYRSAVLQGLTFRLRCGKMYRSIWTTSCGWQVASSYGSDQKVSGGVAIWAGRARWHMWQSCSKARSAVLSSEPSSGVRFRLNACRHRKITSTCFCRRGKQRRECLKLYLFPLLAICRSPLQHCRWAYFPSDL